MTVDKLLERADRYLDRGLPIPMDLAAALMAFGVDVKSLENNHTQEDALSG